MELTPLEWIVAIGASLVGFLVSSTTGIGGALILVPVLSHIIPASEAVALATPVMLVNNVTKYLVLRRHLHKRAFWLSAATSVPFAIVGAMLIGVVPEAWLRAGIGVFMVLYSVAGLWRSFYPAPPRPPTSELADKRRREGALLGWGVATGLASGIVAAGGPPNAVALRTYGLVREAFVATGAVISILMQLTKLPVYIANGALPMKDLPLGLALCAAALVAANTGARMLGRISPVVFERLLLVVLLVLGVSMAMP